MDKWHRENPGETLTVGDLQQLLNILLMGASPQNVKKGFRSTGIWPFNPDIFNRDYFLPASVTDRPPPDESLHGPSTTTSSHLLMGSPLLPSYLLLGRRPPPSHLLLSCPLLLCMSHLVPWLFLTINSDSLEEVTLILFLFLCHCKRKMSSPLK